jgi:hypothetical protein
MKHQFVLEMSKWTFLYINDIIKSWLKIPIGLVDSVSTAFYRSVASFDGMLVDGLRNRHLNLILR